MHNKTTYTVETVENAQYEFSARKKRREDERT